MPNSLLDSFGRTIDYLRISVTDRCQFRCVYCLPTDGVALLPRSGILSFEEITRIARIFLSMGGTKLKITGGEPLQRKNIEDLVSRLARLDGLKDLGLTTNGFHLKRLAKPLFEVGLKRVNVSLDSMDPKRFARLTHSFSFERVWEGIEEALRVGLKLKLNVVVMKGITAKELSEFGDLVYANPIAVRFIEFMPLCGTGWHPEWMLPLKTVEDFFRTRYTLEPIPRGSSTAKTYRLADGHGQVGFIASMTEPFCDRCSRLRLTSDGKLRNCLFSNGEIDLRETLRRETSDDGIRELIQEAVSKKPKGHEISPEIRNADPLPRIRTIGG